ncbi:MAG: Re/Si-specific NAD(P)(+) transhydrogenase subunit alpha [Gemmatimonadetes bacterium]|nr:MAG: Re/Si-specific NAD(P)(+) transhydrogenase subunit alpha [Gemmatimonadota bacterium]
MKVAVLAETAAHETRVALTPSSVADLTRTGASVSVQAGAGAGAHIPDQAYRDAGAEVAPDRAAVLSDASIVLKVQPPDDEEIAALARGTVLVSLLNPLTDPRRIARLAEAGITAFALELIPRITRAQRMDVLSSQATVAGYKAVLMGADALHRFLPMFMTAAGTIRPGKVLVLGAGVAGLQAIATARRLGARVEAFDVRPAVKEQVESLGATFIEAEEEVTAEGEGGYAAELSDDQHQKELDLIARHIADADLVVTTAQIPGKPAPLLITEAMLDTMKPGSVVVDLAGESGGNCAVTRAGETVTHGEVRVMGPLNLPAALPVHASEMFSKNVVTFVREMIDEEGALTLDFEDEIIAATCVAHGGEIRNERTKQALAGPA